MKYRWNILPQDQKAGIKTYIVDLVIKLSSSLETLEKEKVILGKVNMVLVEVLFFLSSFLFFSFLFFSFLFFSFLFFSFLFFSFLFYVHLFTFSLRRSSSMSGQKIGNHSFLISSTVAEQMKLSAKTIWLF